MVKKRDYIISMKALEIKNQNHFEKLLDDLIDDVVTAKFHYKLFLDLRKSVKDYEDEFNEARTFWFLTLNAHVELSIFRLCRIYDQYKRGKGSLNLQSLIVTIKENKTIFNTNHFRKRMKKNPDVESLSKTQRIPGEKQLLFDIERTGNKDPLVKKLCIWRNSIFAHKAPKPIMEEMKITKIHPLTYDNLSELIDRALSILNHYQGLFRAKEQSSTIVGHYDYKYILRTLKHYHEQKEKKIAAEIENLRKRTRGKKTVEKK